MQSVNFLFLANKACLNSNNRTLGKTVMVNARSDKHNKEEIDDSVTQANLSGSIRPLCGRSRVPDSLLENSAIFIRVACVTDSIGVFLSINILTV